MGKANMQSARAAYEAMGKKSNLWSPDPGVYFTRIIEPIGAMDDKWFIGFPLHWGLGDPVICPRRAFGGICPICQYAQRLPEDDAKRYWPGWSAYINMLLVDEDGDPIPDSEGEAQVVTWRVGRETLGKIFNAIERESPSVDKLIDITDSKTGIDLRVKRTGKGKDDTDWDISCVKRGPSSIEEYREAWEPKALDLTEFVAVKGADELAQLLTGSQDAFTQAQNAKPSAKKQLKAPTKAVTEAVAASEEGAEEVKHVATASVITSDGEVIDAPQQSSSKAKLQALMNRNKGGDA